MTAEEAKDAGQPQPERSRRELFATAAGVAAVAAAGTLLSADPADATQGDPAICGLNNSETAVTTFTNTASGDGVAGAGFGSGKGVVGTGGASSGIGVSGTGGGPNGVGVTGTGQGSGTGVVGKGGSLGGIGISGVGGDGAAGVQGTGGGNATGVIGVSSAAGGTGDGVLGQVSSGTSTGAGVHGVTTGKGPAGRFRANSAQLLLQPVSAGRAAPTTDAVAHTAGELLCDGSGDLWYCAIAGTPGTWRRLAGGGTAGAFNVLPAPVRVYDSRPGTLPAVGSKTPLAANTPRTLDATANSSGVPAGATAITVNLLLVNATAGNGNFTIWANGIAKPAANNMVWGGDAGRFSSVAVTAVDATGKCQVQSSLQTDFVLDIVGFYR